MSTSGKKTIFMLFLLVLVVCLFGFVVATEKVQADTKWDDYKYKTYKEIDAAIIMEKG